MPDTAGPGTTRPADAAGVPAGPPPRRRRARHRARPALLTSAFGRGSLLAVGLAVLVGVAVLVAGLAGGTGTGGPPVAGASPDDTPPSSVRSSAPGGAPAAPGVVDWLSSALPPGTGLAASAEARTALTGDGVPADRLRPAEDGVPAGLLAAVVGPAPAGARVVATFDRPGGSGPLLVVDPAPGEPTPEELQRRQALAAALLANPTTEADGAVVDVLSRAEVDQRLLTLLAGLAARDGIGIGAFPVLPGEEGSTAPARRAVLVTVGGTPVPADPAATERLVAWLDAQLPPLAPDEVEVTPGGVLVSYHYVSDPDAVVTAATR